MIPTWEHIFQHKTTYKILYSFSFYLVKFIKLTEVFCCFPKSFIQNFNNIWPLHKQTYTITELLSCSENIKGFWCQRKMRLHNTVQSSGATDHGWDHTTYFVSQIG